MKNVPKTESCDDPVETRERAVADGKERLFSRIDSLSDGSPECRRLIESLKEIVERYLFVSAYVAVNRSAPDWRDVLPELVEEEDVWSTDTDEDVLVLFNAQRDLEGACREIRLENKRRIEQH